MKVVTVIPPANVDRNTTGIRSVSRENLKFDRLIMLDRPAGRESARREVVSVGAWTGDDMVQKVAYRMGKTIY